LPATNWERGGQSAPITAVPYINGVLGELGAEPVADLQTYAVYRMFAVLRSILIHEFPRDDEIVLPASEKDLPKESKGLGPVVGNKVICGLAAGVNDLSALVVEGFQLTQHELSVLAGHYENTAASIQYVEVYPGQYGGAEGRSKYFAERRLFTIETVLGETKFAKAIEGTRAKWTKTFEQNEEAREKLLPCIICGADRRSEFPQHYPDGHCFECAVRCEECGTTRRRYEGRKHSG